ncbi:MAG TPA: protein-L-isoaspartate(D-aspartate) O-methyltransferase [Caldimonas sp.]|nr:protein-L-isoaspartate(D-aspartate) O-methyltransferase [Caldimonas sp.]
MAEDDDTARRAAMVDLQVHARGIRDPALLAAMREVPRHEFVAARLRRDAYEDTPLPIEERQTISQPYIVALMLEAARLVRRDRVLEVGAGSGYASAVASRLAAHVDAIERHPRLVELARERLRRLGFANVDVHEGDGSVGWPEGAPYDAIVVAAAGPRVPEALRLQLAPGGRLVMPVGDPHGPQRLVRLVRESDDRFEQTDLGGVMFVPLVGAQGWRADPNGD